jgi:RNA polymerase sigma-70 factor (sigma-E family)
VEPNSSLKRHEDVTSVIGSAKEPSAVAPAESDFERFYRLQYPDAIRLAWLLTHSSAGCEDIVQEAFVAVLGRFGELDAPAAYLNRTLANLCRSWIRREVVRRRIRGAELPLAAEEMSLPEAELLAAVQRLPFRQRVVVVVRYWGDWSEQETAEALGCRPGTVKSLRSRALERLNRELQ